MTSPKPKTTAAKTTAAAKDETPATTPDVKDETKAAPKADTKADAKDEAPASTDGVPDPLSQYEAGRDIHDAQSSDSIRAEQDNDVITDPAALGWQISQFDETGGRTVLDSLANPPAAAVRAAEVVEAAQRVSEDTDTDLAEAAVGKNDDAK